MTVDIAKIIREFSLDVINAAREIMSSNVGINEKTGTNTLVDSDLYNNIDYKWREEGNKIIMDTVFNFYIVYINWERPKNYGKMPPIDAIVKWMKKKNIVPNNKSVRSVAYLIARAIQRDGHKARPVLNMLFEKSESLWDNLWAERLFDAITKELESYFDN